MTAKICNFTYEESTIGTPREPPANGPRMARENPATYGSYPRYLTNYPRELIVILIGFMS